MACVPASETVSWPVVQVTGCAVIGCVAGVACGEVVATGAGATVVEGTVVDVELAVEEVAAVVLGLLADLFVPEQAPTTTMPATTSNAAGDWRSLSIGDHMGVPVGRW